MPLQNHLPLCPLTCTKLSPSSWAVAAPTPKSLFRLRARNIDLCNLHCNAPSTHLPIASTLPQWTCYMLLPHLASHTDASTHLLAPAAALLYMGVNMCMRVGPVSAVLCVCLCTCTRATVLLRPMPGTFKMQPGVGSPLYHAVHPYQPPYASYPCHPFYH